MARRRVVITGLGLVSPVGNDVATGWANIVAGKSGITRISKFDAQAMACQVAGEVRDFDVSAYIPAKDARRMDVFIHYGMAAGIQAVRDAGLESADLDPERVGVIIGSGIGGLPMIEDTHNAYLAGGPRKISPFFIPGALINLVSGQVSIRFGFKGPNHAVVTACSTGAHSIGEAMRTIRHGYADAMLAEGLRLAKIAPNIAVKVPLTWAGLKTCKTLADQGQMVNVTLCFSANQALLAAKAGATFISPFVGRMDDINLDGMELIQDIRTIYDNYGFTTQILAASIRSANHVSQAALIGADVVTAPAAVLKGLVNHPLTDKGLAQFTKDWAATGQKIV